MTTIDVEVQVGTTPQVGVDVQVGVPTFTITGILPTGPRGPAGATGATGATGPAGAAGAAGADGEGVPVGGTTGQVLAKASDDDFDTEWVDQSGGGGSGVVESIVAGSNIDVDATDPANPIVSVETLVDADIPASIARDAEVTAAVDAEATIRAAADTALDGRLDSLEAISIATDAELAAEAALARNADNLTSGTVADARIPSSIARDTEVQGLIDAAINALLDGAPGALDTLNELAAAVNDDATFAASVTTALAGKQPLDADLTAIAALTTTTIGRSLLAAVDDAALRTILGLGTAATSASSAFQPADADLTALAGAGNSAVLAATTASFLTADETKLDGIEAGADVTDATNVAAAGAAMLASGGTFAADIVVPDEAYDATAWNGSLEVPTKNAVRDKIETLGGGTVSDAAYGSGWNGDTTSAPSKNAVYDKIETLGAAGLLAVVDHHPTTQATYSTTSATFADMDATNLVITFTAPASGSVLVKQEAEIDGTTSVYQEWNLRNASGDIAGTVNVFSCPGVERRISCSNLVTGLTPGNSYTWKWGYRRNSGASAAMAYAKSDRHAVMEVHAVPL